MNQTQYTLTGEPADEDGVCESSSLPETYVLYCPTCDERLLRSEAHGHAHRLYKSGHQDGADDPVADDDDAESGPVEVGNWYDIELSYSVTYRLRVPAPTEHRAEDIAELWATEVPPGDRWQTHTRRTEQGTITTADVPVDWDRYGAEPLHEALARAGVNVYPWEIASDDE